MSVTSPTAPAIRSITDSGTTSTVPSQAGNGTATIVQRCVVVVRWPFESVEWVWYE